MVITNGDMIKAMFPNITVRDNYYTYAVEVKLEYHSQHDTGLLFDKKWWNAPYKALPSVTPQLSSELEKNSKKLEKDFGELDCISRADVRSLVVKIGRKDILGMSGKTFQDLYKGIDALPSVMPQEPFINKPCVSSGVCEHDKQKVLDKIRAEIEQNAYPIVHGVNNHELGMTLYGILQIIDKYKAESEHKE